MTGVLLSGEKGSGKTLLGKKLAVDLLTRNNQPIITVDFGVSGQMFASFLQRIGQPITLFFDEFEKIYNEESQNGLLSLLDGVYPVKMLAILTTNDNSRLSQPLLNRPGRIFYKIDYNGLDFSFVKDYVEENLANKENVNDFLRLATMVELNFDQMKALVEEMNRYDETVLEAVQMLNVDMESDYATFDLKALVLDGKNISADRFATTYLDTALSLDEDEDDDSNIQIGYWDPNPENLTGAEIYAKSEKVLKEHIYTVQNVFGYRCNFSSHEAVKGIPRVATLNKGAAKMSVRPNGMIDMVDSVSGVTISISRKKLSNRKGF